MHAVCTIAIHRPALRDIRQKGMAVITADGRRGWVIYDMAISPMSSVAIEPEECPDFIASLEDNNWEVIPITRKDVDLDKHFTKRGDDGDYDMTAGVLWDGPSCNWCGHPRLKHDDDPLDGTHPCEACGANPDDPEGGIRLDSSKPFPAIRRRNGNDSLKILAG